MIVELKNSKEHKILLDKDELIVLDLGAERFCPPCRKLGYLIKEELSQKYPNVTFVKIDVEKHEELAYKYDVRLMPTIVFMKKGKVLKNISGFKKEEIEKTLEKLTS